MAILKCKMCGGDIELSADKTFGTCEYCGSTMTFPKVDDEQRAAMFNRGNHFRRTGEFDKALAVYERIVQEDEDDAEAHWCCALCRFGIEYVEDPNTLEYLPTCHRASFDSFLDDVDYLAALEHSDGVTRRQYQKDAAKIAEVQRGILATSQNEEPFDVFLCYKETEEDGSRTRDSLYAQDIYYQLTEQGRRVFFSRITLEDKAGTEYEPYIFAALNSAKVMVLVTTSAEHANSVWVKNEWSRFLSLMRKDRSKLLLPCYRDMDPYDLPEALSVLQSYDMSKIGFIQDLIRGVNKVLNAAKPKAQTVKETVVVQQPANPAVTPLLKRAFLFLEDGDWQSADEYCEKVLDMDPENGEAYLGKLMTELHVRKREALKDQPQPFENQSNYAKAMRFGNDKLRQELAGVTAYIQERNETARQKGIYQQAMAAMSEKSVQGYRKAAELFASVAEYSDAAKQREKCLQRAETIRQDGIYQQALAAMKERSAQGYQKATALLSSISDYKDAQQKISDCAAAAEDLRQGQIYQKAADLARGDTEDGYEKAAELFASIPEHRDARDRSLKCREKAETIRKEQVYRNAVKLASYRSMAELEEAARLFGTVSGYKDADKQLFICQNKIQDLLAKEEARRLKRQQKEQQVRADEEHRKNRKPNWTPLVVGLIAVALIAVAVVVVLPGIRAKKEVDVEQPVPTETTDAPISTAAPTQEPGINYSNPKYPKEFWDQHAVRNTIAAGYSHTVRLKTDSTVVAVGKNDDGQCNVSGWSDIVAVAAGKAHTVGLKADDTVVAVGDNKYGQCDVTGWKDIVAVAAGNYHTVGLKADGTVVAVGSNWSRKCNVSDWTDIVAIAAGSFHTVGLKADGTVVTVGANDAGQCNVSGWTDIVAIATGYALTMGLKADGTVVAVGEDKYAQRNVNDWTDIVAIAAGNRHAVGLKKDGTVVAVGSNKKGQCNVSYWNDWNDIVAIAAGEYHTVGLKADGTVVACGDNESGQCDAEYLTAIHVPGAQSAASEPTQAAGITYSNPKYPKEFWDQHAVHGAIAASNHTVAIKADGTVVATGSNDHGQCNVSSWENIVAIAAGYQHSIGLKSDGTVVATEYTGDQTDNRGQCEVSEWEGIVAIAAGTGCSVGLKSDGTVVATGQMKTKVSSWTDIIAITAGETHIVAVKNDGTVVAYGNASGQGNVSDWKNIVAIAAGHSHTVGLKADGTVIATGTNENGQCNVSDWTDITAIAAASKYTIGLKKDGTVVIAGSEDVKKKLDVSEWKDIVAIAAGYGHVVGLKSDGTMVAVGSKANGKLDISSWTDIRLPEKQPAVSAPPQAVVQSFTKEFWAEHAVRNTIAAGGANTIAIQSDGRIVVAGRYAAEIMNDCAGWSDIVSIAPFAMSGRGVLGLKADGTVAGVFGGVSSDIPDWTDIVSLATSLEYAVGLKSDGTVVVDNIGSSHFDVSQWSEIVAVAAGRFHVVGLKADGTVVATGNNEKGQCDVDHWTDIVAIAAGQSHTVGLRADGTVVAVGDKSHGECMVSGWTDVTQIAAGYLYTLGLRKDGTVLAVGRNTDGQRNVFDWKEIVAISAMFKHSVGLKADGTVVACGDNEYGQCNVSYWTDIRVPER